MSFATDMQQVADELLTEFDERPADQKIKLLLSGGQVWNPADNSFDTQPDTEHDLTGVAVPYAKGLVDGTMIQAGDVRLTVTRAEEVTTADKVQLDSVQYSVVSVAPYSYTGDALNIAYQVQLRR